MACNTVNLQLTRQFACGYWIPGYWQCKETGKKSGGSSALNKTRRERRRELEQERLRELDALVQDILATESDEGRQDILIGRLDTLSAKIKANAADSASLTAAVTKVQKLLKSKQKMESKIADGLKVIEQVREERQRIKDYIAFRNEQNDLAIKMLLN